jgi:capsular polysaccharide biosynthesis protein
MEEIDIKEFLLYALQKLWIILAVLVVVLSAGEAYSIFFKTPLYNSSTNIVLISDNSKQLTNNDVALSNNLVKTYSEIIKSRNVINKTIKSLGLEESYEQLVSKVSVSSATQTQLITIKVTDKDSKRAEKIANEIAKIFKAEIISIYGIDNVQIVDEAVEATNAFNKNIVKESIIYALAGIALGVGVTFLVFMLDKTIKDSETVENKLGLTVVGVVPQVEQK